MAKTEIISKELYNGEVNIDFYPNSHIYKLVTKNEDGKQVKESLLSVTGICGVTDKPWLINRAVNLAKDYLLKLKSEGKNIIEDDIIEASKQHTIKRDKAGEIGTMAHDWVEQYIKLGTMSLPEDENVANAVNGFLEWINGKNIKFIESERFCYSKKYKYVGTLDSIAIIDGKKYLIDFKTSNGIDIFGYGMQTSAYLKAYEEETNDKIDGIIIARFSKETHDKYGRELVPFEIQEIIDIDYLYDCFLAALVLKNGIKKYDKFN